MKKFSTLLLMLALYFPVNAQTVTAETDSVKTKGCVDGDCISLVGKYLFVNGDKYNGEWREGKRYGYGRYDWKNGEWYLGDFTDDKITGTGSFHLLSGKWIGGNFEDCVLVKTNTETDSVIYKNYKIQQMAPKSEVK